MSTTLNYTNIFWHSYVTELRGKNDTKVLNIHIEQEAKSITWKNYCLKLPWRLVKDGDKKNRDISYTRNEVGKALVETIMKLKVTMHQGSSPRSALNCRLKAPTTQRLWNAKKLDAVGSYRLWMVLFERKFQLHMVQRSFPQYHSHYPVHINDQTAVIEGC